jgi:hypothetical protein
VSDEPATQTPGDRLREIADRLERMRQDTEENNDRMNSGRFFRDRLDKGEK